MSVSCLINICNMANSYIFLSLRERTEVRGEPGILRVTNVTLSRRAPSHGWLGWGLAEHLSLAMDGNVCVTYPHPTLSRKREREIR